MPGIVFARGSLAGVRQVLGDAMLGDPAGDALAELDLELLGRLVDVLADLALHRDRDQVLADEPVDPDVVVVDELAQLGRDREADLAVARQPRQADAELLDRLELGRPGRHLLEVLGVLDRDRRLRREGGHRLELVVGPVVRRVVVDVQQAEQLGAVEQRRRADRVEALLDDGRPDVARRADRRGSRSANSGRRAATASDGSERVGKSRTDWR